MSQKTNFPIKQARKFTQKDQELLTTDDQLKRENKQLDCCKKKNPNPEGPRIDE